MAEYEVLNTLEQSWGGTCAHVREGWNIGKPPYGYRAKQYRHPNPSKAAHGNTKTRLEPDGLRGETVTQIALWRYEEGLGYATIADRLNADLDRFPPPEAPAAWRSRGAWSKSTIEGILRNPKYTGYQVYNRRASRSRHGQYNDPRLWVWSPQPVHEPLIPKWMFDRLAAARQGRRATRDGNDLNSHPATKRTYLLRGLVFCDCGRRMRGVAHPNNRVYYQCAPAANNRGRPDKHTGHPRVVHVREEPLLDAIAQFYRDRVFGPDRRQLLAQQLSDTTRQRASAQAQATKRRDRELAHIQRHQQNLLRQAQELEPDDPFARALRTSYLELEERRRALAIDIPRRDQPTPQQDIGLLDQLPVLGVHLHTAPEQLQRRLYDATQLSIQIHPEQRSATIHITLNEPTTAGPDGLARALTTTDDAAHVDMPTGRAATTSAAAEQHRPDGSDVSMSYVPPVEFEPTLQPF